LAQPVINTNTPGSFTYYLSQTVNTCESGRTPVTVQVVPQAPPPTVTSPIAYCQNDPSQPLQAVGQNLLWYTSDTALAGTPIVPTPNTGSQDTMTWYVSQTINGCESVRVPVEVYIKYRPNALVLASRDYVCAGDTLLISYYGNADGDLGVTFNWSFPSGSTVLSGSGQGPYIIRFNTAGNQRITLTADNGGCASPQAHYDVEVRAIPEFTLNIQESACQGDLVNLSINQITPAIDLFVWDIAGGEKVYASETAGPYGVKWNTPGPKTITVTATDNACTSPVIQDEIFIRALPDARITVLGDKICAGDSIQLEGLYSPDYSYQWLPEQFFSEINSYRQWAKIDYAREITLNITDIYNCKSTNTIFIQPENCCTVSFPTAFTPNEDTRNDVFRPITAGNQKITKFIVKNRWGLQVFESADDRRGWDGKLGGIPQDMGAYFYYIKYQCSDGKYYEDRGEVMLVR
jgi:gliding motility-associated-like protein